MANRKEPKRAKRKRRSPSEEGVASGQRTLAAFIERADPAAKPIRKP
jgi:hypothetical protein